MEWWIVGFLIYFMFCVNFENVKFGVFFVFMILWIFMSLVFEGDKIRIYIFCCCCYISVLG